MKIIFDERPGRIMDLINSLKFIYNNSFQGFLDELGVKSNKHVENTLNYLSKNGNFNWEYTDIFFNGSISVIDYVVNTNDMWSIMDEKNILNYIKNVSEKDIKNKIIKSLLNNINSKETKIDTILYDNKKLINLISHQEFPDQIKWKLLDFINNSSIYMENLLLNLKNYIKIFDKALEKNKTIIDNFNTYVQNQINLKGIKFLEEYTKDAFNYNNFPDIYLSTAFINCYSLQGGPKENRANLFIGIEFFNLIKQLGGKGNIEKNLNVFRNLCDNSRFQILKLLLNGGLYAQELANKLGISMPTVSYHINFLLSSNLVTIEKQDGRKVYYVLNKKTLKSCTDFLINIFKLDD